MRQKLPTLVGQVLLLTVLSTPIILCAEQWSRPLSERRSDDWIPISTKQIKQVEHTRDLKSAGSSIDQIGSLLTPPIPPNVQHQSRVLRNPAPQLTSNGFLNQPFKSGPPQPPQQNQQFFQFTTAQPFSIRQQQAAPSQQTFKNEAVNNQFNSFLGQDPNQFPVPVPNQFVQPQQLLFPQSHFPSPTFFQNQAFGEQGRVPQIGQQGPKNIEPVRSSKVRFPDTPTNQGGPAEDTREEIQLLYVPVETLQQRGRNSNKLKTNDGGKFKDGPPPPQPNFFPQQIVPQFQNFPPIPQFNQPEFPPIPQFVDNLSVKHRFNKPQIKPERPQTFQNDFIQPQTLQQTFPQDFQSPPKPGNDFPSEFVSPPKEQKFPQEPQKIRTGFQQEFPPPPKPQFQQEFRKPQKPSSVDFTSFQQEFQLPDKSQQNFQFEFQQQNVPSQSQTNFPPPPPPQIFSQPPQNFPPPPSETFIQQQPNFQETKFNEPQQNFPEPPQTFQEPPPNFSEQQKFAPPPTTTPRNTQTEESQLLNEVTPTKSVFTESSPQPVIPSNNLPPQDPPLPGMTLAQFVANEQFFPQFSQQTSSFPRPNFDPSSEPQVSQTTPDFPKKQQTTFLQPAEQEPFRASPPIPVEPQFTQPQFQGGRVTNVPSTLPPPHQPPLSVYMENVHNSKVGDVLNLLKSSKTIPVLDSVDKETPQIFVGPSNLEPPPGYVKFELPYLSSLDTNRIERKVDKLPFFVAPLNFQPPSGYSKIPFPAPHIGSVVVSNATILKAALHEKPFETQGIFEQSTPSVYTLPAEINTISPHLPSQVNSLQTTPRFTTEAEAPPTESTTQRRTRYRTTTAAPANQITYQQRRPSSTSSRQRKPLHRGFPKSGQPTTTTTTTTEAPLEITTLPAYVPEISQNQGKTHFGSQEQYIEQTIVPAGGQQQSNQQSSNDQNPQQSFDNQYYQQQQSTQQFDLQSTNQQIADSIPTYNDEPPKSEVSNQEQQPVYQEQQIYNQESYNQEQQAFSQVPQTQQDQFTYPGLKSESQSDSKSEEPNPTTTPVEISSSNYQNILSPSQYHSELTGKDQFNSEKVVEQTSGVQQQTNEQIGENQYSSQNQIDQNNFHQNENRFESQPQETTAAPFVEINEPETEKPEKFSKNKNKYFHKTREHSNQNVNAYTVPDQASILQAHQVMNAYLANEQPKEQETASQATTEATEESTTKKLRGRVRGRQRFSVRTSTAEPAEEQNYPKNFHRTEHAAESTSQNYPVYHRQTENSQSESTSEAPASKADKYNAFKRRRPIRPTSTTASPAEEETSTTSAPRSRVRVTTQPGYTPRTATGRTRLRRPGASTPASVTTSTSTEAPVTDNLDWGTYVNSFAPSAGSNEVISPYDDKSITFHNIESHRRNPNYNKVKNEGYWNNGVTSQLNEGEANQEAVTPTEATPSKTESDSSTTQHSKPLDRKALYRQRLRYGAVSNDQENVQHQQNQLKRVNAHKERIASSKKLANTLDDSTYDANTLQQSEGRVNHRGEDHERQQSFSQKSEDSGNQAPEFSEQEKISEDKPTEEKKASESANGKKAGVGRRRGAWVRVRVKKPQDVFETAESQSFAKLSGNAIKNLEKTRAEEITAKDQRTKTLATEAIKLVQEEAQPEQPEVAAQTVETANPERDEAPKTEQEQNTDQEKNEEYSPEQVVVQNSQVEEETQSQKDVVQEPVESAEPAEPVEPIEHVEPSEPAEQETPEEPKQTETAQENQAPEAQDVQGPTAQEYQKDIGDMIREIINGESELDEIEQDKDHGQEVATEPVTEKQDGVNEALVATTAVPTKNQSTVATTISEAETTVFGRHSEEQETTTAIPTTTEPELSTKRIVSTSTTTEISLETEICYKGRCVKSKKTKATDLLPSE